MPGNSLDTNVLIYMAMRGEKAARATQIVIGGGVVSVQVLNEFANVSRRKLGWTWDEIREFLAFVETLVDVRSITTATHELGLLVAERHRLATYDAMIVAAAIEADCEVLYSEDMHHGLRLGRLTIVNPFV